MTQSFIFNSLAFNELVPEFGLNNVDMMPVSFNDEQARNNLNGQSEIIYYLMKIIPHVGLINLLHNIILLKYRQKIMKKLQKMIC